MKKEVREFWYTDDYHVLYETEGDSVQRLFDIYSKNRYAARVYYMNNKNLNFFIKQSSVLFTNKDGSFSINYFEKKFGISKTNVIYSSKRKTRAIIYKNNKFWHRDGNGKLKHLLINDLIWMLKSDDFKFISPMFFGRFYKLEFLMNLDTRMDRMLYFSVNTLIRLKLYNQDKLLINAYKMPKNIVKSLFEKNVNPSQIKPFINYIVKTETMNVKMLETSDLLHIFYDTLSMAEKLDKKVNLNWSVKRFKDEHDTWAKEINEIIYKYNNTELNNHKAFLDFEDFSGFKLFKWTKDLAFEGINKKHCVGSYAYHINSHRSGIYSVYDYTLELRKTHDGLVIAQLMGYKNHSAPEEIYNEVQSMVNSFNEQVYKVNYSYDAFDVDYL